MKRILVAGVSGAIGGALTKALLERDKESVVVGLCRDPATVSEPLRSHNRLTLLAWDAEDSQAPDAVARAFAVNASGFALLVQALLPVCHCTPGQPILC